MVIAWHLTKENLTIAHCPFGTGIMHFHSREFGNEKVRESWVPGNEFTNHNIRKRNNVRK